MSKLIDITGKKYGKLTVQYMSDRKWKSGIRLWYCVCDCGGHTYTSSYNLRSGHTTSCGCEGQRKRNIGITKHGKCGTKEYVVYHGMLKRCHNFNAKNFMYYGGRGIFVCRRWRKSFENFYKDMGEQPSDKHTIERIENDGPYAPWNCKWLLNIKQVSNKRNNVWVVFHGEKILLNCLAQKYNINQRTLKARLDKEMDVDQAVSAPVFKPPKYEYQGEFLTLTEIAKIINMNVNTLKGRVGKLKWSLEKTLSTSVINCVKKETKPLDNQNNICFNA